MHGGLLPCLLQIDSKEHMSRDTLQPYGRQFMGYPSQGWLHGVRFT